MPVFMLDGKYGIGTFGEESFRFIDFLKKSGISVWQVLPLSQTVFGDSPYSSTCDASFNPYFCDLEDLAEKGLITSAELKAAESKNKRIDYGKLYVKRTVLIKKAFSIFDFSDEFLDYVNGGKFHDYACFMTAKKKFGSLYNFPRDLLHKKPSAVKSFTEENYYEYLFYVFLQYVLEKQYLKVKDYAKKSGITILGDLPLYVAADSADVWANPDCFSLDEDLKPTKVAGVPPDYFSAEGQLWGNPLYDYDQMKKDGFKFWKNRLKTQLKRYDLLRIDHFRGLDRFWAIPAGKKATDGVWVKAPGKDVLSLVDRKRLVAEDLGVIDDGVKDLLKKSGLPGMKVLLFAFDGNPDNPYLPRNVGENSVCYVGTHDNATALGYAKSLLAVDFAVFRSRINAVAPEGVKVKRKSDVPWALIETALSTESRLAVITAADALGLDDKYRINTPATVGNWTARIPFGSLSEDLAEYLRSLIKKYGR